MTPNSSGKHFVISVVNGCSEIQIYDGPIFTPYDTKLKVVPIFEKVRDEPTEKKTTSI